MDDIGYGGPNRTEWWAKRQKPSKVNRQAPTTETEPPIEIARLSLERRLAIVNDFVVAHPGKAITPILLELFPELRSSVGTYP